MNNALAKSNGRFFDSATNKLLSGVWMGAKVQFFPTFSETDSDKRKESASIRVLVFVVQEMCTCEGFDTNSDALTCPEDKRQDWTNDVEKVAQDLPITIGISPQNQYPTGEPPKADQLQENGLNPFVQLTYQTFLASKIYEEGGPPYYCPGYIIGRNGIIVGTNSWTFEGFEFFRVPGQEWGFTGWSEDTEITARLAGPIFLDTTLKSSKMENEETASSGTEDETATPSDNDALSEIAAPSETVDASSETATASESAIASETATASEANESNGSAAPSEAEIKTVGRHVLENYDYVYFRSGSLNYAGFRPVKHENVERFS